MTPVLDIQNLSVSYRAPGRVVSAVTDFSLSIAPGERVGLVGESGCGKSSIAMAIMRYLGRNGLVSHGAINYQGQDMAALASEALRQVRGGGIAMVYQDPMAALNPTMTIGAQLIETRLAHGAVSKIQACDDAMAGLADVQLSDTTAIMARYPHQLSGGQLQRVVIAMALLPRPNLLLLDEPTTALDATVEESVVDLIGEISSKYRTALLFISHDLGLVESVCDRVCVMYAGQAVEVGTGVSVFTQPRHPYTDALLQCRPDPLSTGTAPREIPGVISGSHEYGRGCRFAPRCTYFEVGVCDTPDMALSARTNSTSSHMVRCVKQNWTRPTEEIPLFEHIPSQVDKSSSRLMLQVNQLSKTYRDTSLVGFGGARDVVALDGVNLTVHKGEIVAVVGESGSGKSTLAKILMGLELTEDGAVLFEAVDVGALRARNRPRSIRRALQMVFQNPDDTLNPSLRVGTQLRRAIKVLLPDLRRSEVAMRATELLDSVRLSAHVANMWPNELSGGQKQRVAIARAFAGAPDIIVADEPLSALDVSVSAAITLLLKSMQRDHGASLLLISHDLAAVRYLADTVVVLYGGKVMERGPAPAVLASPRHPYTQMLMGACKVDVPKLEPQNANVVVEAGTGCPFVSRCPERIGGLCENTPPPIICLGEEQHEIACHLEAVNRSR
ncbi:MAG: ABC transporter ATP-binding protein [Alphaproteobacteria bacterium]|nr:ABC transporter ATP-binding protein [Alphaproteobacteria bacterium]